MMDALITGFVEELKLKLSTSTTTSSNIERTTSVFDGSANTEG